MEHTTDKEACMACTCPCDMHKEHNHAVKEDHAEAKTCTMCGHENKGDKNDCGCGINTISN